MGIRFAGVATVEVDGRAYPLRGNFNVSPSVVERTGIAGQDRVHGFMELPRVPFIEGDISLTPEVSLETLEAMVDVVVTAKPANGNAYILMQAWTKSAFEANTHDGQVRVRWEGIKCDEILG